MAKKKAAAVKKKSTKKKRTTRKKSVVTRPGVAKKKSRTTGKKKAPVRSKKKTAIRKKAARTRSTKKKAKRAKSLGRPRLPVDAKLHLVFQKDYQAREIFEFLGVDTIRELEQYAPDDIIEKLAGPVIQTVGRIRKSLALNNRCLAGDRKFALEFQAQTKQR